MKKLISILTTIIIVLSISTVSASATTKTVQDTGGGNISAGSTGHIGSTSGSSTANVSYGSSWELYAYYDSGNSIIRFGFDTFANNEDYVYGYQKNNIHQASVQNSAYAIQTSSQKAANQWTSKVDITHGACPIWKLYY